MLETLIFSALVCALVGWGTNAVAVRMLFRPYRPVRLGPWSVQGVFPKRQQALAKRLGEMAAATLVPAPELAAALTRPATVDAVRQAILDAVAARLAASVERSVGPLSSVGERIAAKVCAALDAELHRRLPEVMACLAPSLASGIDIASVVEERVTALSAAHLEAMLVQVLRHELRFVEIAGGVLGGIVGMVQGCVWIALQG